MSEQPLSDAELAELHALALLSAQAPAEPVALRTDGPTLAEYVAAGYAAENYPPAGFAPVPEVPKSEAVSPSEPISGEQPVVEGEPIAVHNVPRDYSMGPATGSSIKAFLEAKQAEADAKAAAG